MLKDCRTPTPTCPRAACSSAWHLPSQTSSAASGSTSLSGDCWGWWGCSRGPCEAGPRHSCRMCGMHTAGTNTCSCAEVSILGHACAMLPRQQCEARQCLCFMGCPAAVSLCREAGLGTPRRRAPVQAAAPMVAWSMAGVWQHGGLLCALLGGQAGPTACVVGDATSCATSCAVLPGSGRLPLLQPGMAMHVRARIGPLPSSAAGPAAQLQQPRGLMMPADDASS